MKAFIFDPLWQKLITEDLQQQLNKAGAEPVVTQHVAPLKDCKQLYDGKEERILCLNPDYVGWKLSVEDYKDIPNLKAILCASTSFSWIDTTYANEQEIPVCNIRNFSTEAVAEWAITMLHNVARQVPRLIKDDFPLDFDKDFMKYRGTELQGKTAAVIGLGHIGNAIAKRCAGLGMNVVYWSQSTRSNDYQFLELDELMKQADIVFPAMALNDKSKKILTPELLSTMKSSAMLISVVHELFDEQVVLGMVKSGKLFGFAFEAPPASFQKYEGNVWAAPAFGWVTDGSMHNSMVNWVNNMVDATNGRYPNRVN